MQILGYFKKKNDASQDVENSKLSDSISNDDVLARWQEVLRLNSGDIRAKINIANIYSENGEHDSALEIFNELENHQPDDIFAAKAFAAHLRKTGEFDKARKKWEMIHEREGCLESLMSIAKLDIENKKYEQALSIADKVDELNPGDYRCSLIRGKVCANTERWTDALNSWRLVLEVKKTHYEAELQLVVAMNRLEMYEELIEQVDKSIKNFPNSEPLYSSKRRALLKMGREEEALELIREGCEIFENSPDWIREKVKILYSLDFLEEAEIDCKKVLEESPDNIDFLTLHAWIGQKIVKNTSVV